MGEIDFLAFLEENKSLKDWRNIPFSYKLLSSSPSLFFSLPKNDGVTVNYYHPERKNPVFLYQENDEREEKLIIFMFIPSRWTGTALSASVATFRIDCTIRLTIIVLRNQR